MSGSGYPTFETRTHFAAAIALLERAYYTDAELAAWLTAPQPLLDGATPVELLAAGRKRELLARVQAMDEGTFI